MPILLVKGVPDSRLDVCSGARETNEPCFRPGSLVPSGDWGPIDETERSAWEHYQGGKCLLENIALIRILDAGAAQEVLRYPAAFAVSSAGVGTENGERATAAFEQLATVCRRLAADSPLEHKGRWLAKGDGTSLSTTWDRRGGKLTGLHIDHWERRPWPTLRSARNRVCLNLGPRSRYLIFLAIDLRETAARCGIAPTRSFSTSDAQAYMREHPAIPVYRLRIEPGEAYVAPTECLIHDGQASSAAGEWVWTVFSRFVETDEAKHLSVV
jgi:hypothetical protein